METASTSQGPGGATPGPHCEDYWLEVILQKLQGAIIFKSGFSCSIQNDFGSPVPIS